MTMFLCDEEGCTKASQTAGGFLRKAWPAEGRDLSYPCSCKLFLTKRPAVPFGGLTRSSWDERRTMSLPLGIRDEEYRALLRTGASYNLHGTSRARSYQAPTPSLLRCIRKITKAINAHKENASKRTINFRCVWVFFPKQCWDSRSSSTRRGISSSKRSR